jgi:hypothetical protein
MRFSFSRVVDAIKKYKLRRTAYIEEDGAGFKETRIKETRIFFTLFFLICVVVFIGVEVGNGYENTAVDSPGYNPSSLLWYERPFRWLPPPQSWACEDSVIQSGESSSSYAFLSSLVAVVTKNGFLEYRLDYCKDPRTSKANHGFPYADDKLQNCSVLMLNLLSFSQSAPASQDPVPTRSFNLIKVLLACNTSADVYFMATSQATSTSWDPLGLWQFAPLLTSDCANLHNFSASDPPNFRCTQQLWWYILQYLLSSLSAPTDGKSALIADLEQQNVSSLRIFFDGTQPFNVLILNKAMV